MSCLTSEMRFLNSAPFAPRIAEMAAVSSSRIASGVDLIVGPSYRGSPSQPEASWYNVMPIGWVFVTNAGESGSQHGTGKRTIHRVGGLIRCEGQENQRYAG